MPRSLSVPDPAAGLDAASPGGADSRTALASGALAAALSLAVLAWRGHADTGSAAAPVNAVSHWLWGDESLRRDDVTAAHTLLGGTVHAGSALFWSGLYAWVRRQRSRPTATGAAADAAVITLVAAVVDLKLVPRRLTPGFERRLTAPSLVSVYAALAVGLALGDWLLASRRRGVR